MTINPNTDKAKQQAQTVMHKFMSNMLEENMEQWISLFDDHAVFEFPYAPKHFAQMLQGKAAIYEYIKNFLICFGFRISLHQLSIRQRTRIYSWPNLPVRRRL